MEAGQLEAWKLVSKLSEIPALQDISLIEMMRLFNKWEKADQQEVTVEKIMCIFRGENGITGRFRWNMHQLWHIDQLEVSLDKSNLYDVAQLRRQGNPHRE
jgi:hypothetical protein